MDGWDEGHERIHGQAAMTAQAMLWSGTAAAASLALAASLAERARNRRRALDRVGWVPWQTVTVLAIFATMILAALALHA